MYLYTECYKEGIINGKVQTALMNKKFIDFTLVP